MLIFIAVIIGIVFLIRKYQQGTEGPPKHKPPPPVKAGSSTEMILDEEATEALNGGAPPVLNKDAADGHHGNESSNHGPSSANIPRGESFVSTPMYV
ncbi:hypothetical protein AMECASPLE_006858 [Ameca splendens]|uniref:Uncharacterized protein n=1 Tax=Ameca splendens TaxID=208324 RepID=A0ABV0XNT2_9TELE